ncbi:MAG: hypothetical protein FJY85_07340, partial [Deltaproteobacteria bacterium]|nr:hypothetical protein [Deltaproteobacteria bacterium]
FKTGRLNPRQAGEVREKLRQELESLKPIDVGIYDTVGRTGRSGRLFAEVLPREEVFQGHCLDTAPDLLVVPEAGYDLKASLNPPSPTMRDVFTGMHTRDDAFLIVDDPSIAGRMPNPMITDVAGLIMEAFR